MAICADADTATSDTLTLAGATVGVVDGRPQRRYGAADAEGAAIGGCFIINVTTLGEALDWAARSPNVGDGSRGHTEVRPLLPPPPRPA